MTKKTKKQLHKKKKIKVIIASVFITLFICLAIVAVSKQFNKSSFKASLISNTITCSDTDHGLSYDTKGAVTITYEDGSQRIENDRCNDNGTLKEWFCGKEDDSTGLLRSENYHECEAGKLCANGKCM